jgi:hypothetical protein
MGHRIIIEVGPGGTMTSTVEGAPGHTCEDVSRWLDQLGRVVRHDPTDEARLQVVQDARLHDGRGGRHGER